MLGLRGSDAVPQGKPSIGRTLSLELEIPTRSEMLIVDIVCSSVCFVRFCSVCSVCSVLSLLLAFFDGLAFLFFFLAIFCSFFVRSRPKIAKNYQEVPGSEIHPKFLLFLV
jgi:hypothetical protein